MKQSIQRQVRSTMQKLQEILFSTCYTLIPIPITINT